MPARRATCCRWRRRSSASGARGRRRSSSATSRREGAGRLVSSPGPTMKDNAYRARAERGEVQIGTWVTMIRTPAVLTLLQAAGLDFARVDMEHSAFSMETVADMAVLA